MPPPCVQLLTCQAGPDGKRKRGFSKNAPCFWFAAVCGLVLPSVSPWEIVGKGYHCKYCRGKWRAGKGHTRMITIMDGTNNYQLVVNEPPGKEYARFWRNRMEYMMRVSPNESPRDVPLDPTLPASKRVFLSDAASDILWKAILADPGETGRKHLDTIARKALAAEHEAASRQ